MADAPNRKRALRDRCPICGELPTDAVAVGAMSCIIRGGDRCVRRGFERLERLVALKDRELLELRPRVLYLEGLLNSAPVADFLESVRVEAAHQVERWGVQHDDGKAPTDWLWLLGHLATKATTSATLGDTTKALHHVVTSAAVLLNWHARISGNDRGFRPGTSEPTT